MYHRESRIMRKLLGKTTPDATPGDLSTTNTPASLAGAYRPIKSQNAVYPVGVPISCLDVAPERCAAVLGGPHILKTFVLDSPDGLGFNVGGGIDIRAIITSQKTSGTKASVVADQLNIRDVKWHDPSTIITACATGRIFSYDLARLAAGGSESFEFVQTQEDSRQVNSLDVNPHLKSWLLSGSQDGVARVFDLSAAIPTRSGVLTFRQRFSPLKSNDPVRQVMWSPRVGHEMACCTEAGVILKWDVRQPSRPVLRVNAHEKACSAIAWHPDGTHLISAGWDTKVHVWDLGNAADKRQKPKWSITTAAPVSAIAWRPPLWSASAQTRRSAQIAVSYDENSKKRYGTSVVHIWDIARPTMPYKEIERFDASPSALFWRDQDMLWTVGQDGLFNQCDVAFAPKSIDRLSTSAMAFSPRGDTVMFLDERTQRSRSRTTVYQRDIDGGATYSANPNTSILSGSKSDSEEEVMNSFLGPRKRMGHTRRLSYRGGQLLSTTPPSTSNMPEEQGQSLTLEQSINVTGIFKTQQAMTWGQLPCAKTVPLYEFISASYLNILDKELPYVEEGKTLVQRVAAILEQFAVVAERVNLFRLSQTWRILAFAMEILLNKRGQYHLDERLSRFQKRNLDNGRSSSRIRPSLSYGLLRANNGEETPRRAPPGPASSLDSRYHGMRSLLSEEIDSTSNVPTPVARPADAGGDAYNFDSRSYQHGRKLTPIIEPESLDLGPAAHSSLSRSMSRDVDMGPATSLSQESEESQVSTTEGYDFYDAEALAKAIDVPFSKPSDATRPKGHGKNTRHGSNESFSQMFSISDGTTHHAKNGESASTSKRGQSRDRTGRSPDKIGRRDSDLEYPSHIRGQEIESDGTGLGDANADARPSTDSPEALFMISQTTASDSTFPSQTSFASQSDSDLRHPHHASSTLAPDNRSILAESIVQSTSSLYQHDPRTHIIETDYLPWPEDPDYPELHGGASPPPAALNPYTLVKCALDFESRTSALNASAMILLLKPLVPDDVIDAHQARGILRQHHKRLMGMGLFVEAVLLRKMCVQGWPDGLPDWGISYPPITMPAQQMVKVGLFCSTCQKPREVDHANDIHAIWTCERCRAVMAPCAVCNHREAELPASLPNGVEEAFDSGDEPWLSMWWYCPVCGHGGHGSCLLTWHGVKGGLDNAEYSADKYSGGCCPLDGCGHACLPGKYRGETTTARADELGRAAVDNSKAHIEQERTLTHNGSKRRSLPGGSATFSAGGGGAGTILPTDKSVRSDSNDVPQSRAVGMAREALNRSGAGSPVLGPGGGSSAAFGGGILSSSPGRVPGTGERERRKSVKFVQSG